MKLSQIKKTIAIIFAYSLLIKLMICYTLSFNSEASYIAFPVCLMMFTWMCVEEYNSKEVSSYQIVLTILIGTLVVTLPVRFVYFHDTISSLPEEVLGVAGIIMGWLLAYKRQIWLLLLVLMLYIIISQVLTGVW